MAVSITGGLVCFIAVLNTAYQMLAHNGTDSRKTKRLLVAALSTLAGTLLFAQSQIDYLPALAFLVACYAETCSRQRNIYKLYLLSVALWVAYAAAHGDMVYAALSTVILGFNLYALRPDKTVQVMLTKSSAGRYRHRRARSTES